MLKLLISLLMAISLNASANQVKLEKSYPEYNGQVLQFFSYVCQHCKKFHFYIEDWKEKNPKVKVTKIPVGAGLNNPWGSMATFYYVLEELGMLNFSYDVYVEYEKKPKSFSTRITQEKWLNEKGVSKELIKKAYNSESVKKGVIQAKAVAQKFKIEAVPILIVNGEYLISPEETTYEDMLIDTKKLLK